MTDTRLGRSPRSDAELVREFDRRLKALERSQTARIGPWVLSAPDGRLLATRPGEAALEVGQAPTPEVVDLSARGSVVSDMNTADLANAVGMPDVDPDAPPTIDQIRQWMVTNLFGPVSPGRIQQLPWAHLGGGTAELLDDPGFDSSATFDAGDPNITRNAEFGRTKPGSAQIVANGAAHLVVSNLISVEQGEKLPVGVWVFYEELVATAAPVRVSVRAYHRNADDSLTLLSTTQVAALTATSGESADHPDQDDDWVWLGGTYAVPGPVGGLTVTDVVLEAKVTEDATGGTINVDDATVTKTRDGLPQDWILNLVPDLASVWNGVAGTVETIMTSLGLTPSGTFWDDLFDLSDEIAWIQDKANDAGADAAAALADLASKLGISDWDNWLSSTWNGFKATLLTNPGSLLGMLGMNKITDLPALNTDFVALQNILSGAATTPPTTLLQQVKDWWTATQQKTQHLTSGGNLPPANVGSPLGNTNFGQDLVDTLNKLWDGFNKTSGSTGKTPDDVQAAALEVINTATSAHVNIETANAAVATWQSAFTQQQMAQPLWLTGTDGTCEVTIPLAWCQYWADPENGGHNSFALSCGVGSHTHPVDTIPIAIEEFTVKSIMAGIDGPGQFVGGVMRCRGGDLKDTITTNGLMTSGCRFVIYEMDVTNGSVKLLYESVDQPILGSISGGPIVHEMPAGSEFITTVGQVLVVGVWAPVDALAVLAGCPISQGYNSASSAFPKSIGVRDTGWSGNAPSTMSNGDFTYMTFESSSYADLEAATVPFFGLGSASPPAPVVRRRFVSQFATIGVSDWVNVTGPFGTINGELSSTALAAGVYKDPLATDSAATEIHLSPTRTIGKTRIAVKSNAEMSKWIGVEFDRTSSTVMTAKIVTGTGPDSGLTTRFTSANVGALTDIGPYEPDPITGETRVGGPRFRMTYDQASNTYELFKLSMYWTWDSLGTWVDSGGFTVHGLEYRYGGAVTGVSGSPNRGQPVTQVSFYDR